MKLQMFHKLETAEEPCGAGMQRRQWSDHRTPHHTPCHPGEMTNGSPWQDSHLQVLFVHLRWEAQSKDYHCPENIQCALCRLQNWPQTLDWLPSVTKLFVFRFWPWRVLCWYVLIQILSFVVKSFSLNKDPQQSEVVKIGKCPEGLSRDFCHHQ